jgi:single-strand DNA-binding protein
MFDTTVTIVGNALNTPELRRTNGTNTLVASFRVASTSRRYDRDSGRWVDGPSLRVRVTCWRRLAEGVNHSVVTGDPLVVTGRMYTRDWIGDDGQHRVSYELEAIAVGHDLSRGFADFKRHRPSGATSVVEDAESDARIAGELSVPAGDPSGRQRGDLDELSPSDAPTPTFEPPSTRLSDSYDGFDPAGAGTESPDDGTRMPDDGTRMPDDGTRMSEQDAMNVIRAAGLGGRSGNDGAGEDGAGEDGAGDDGAAADRTDAEASARRRGRSRLPVPA